MWKRKDDCRWGNFLFLNLQKKLAWINIFVLELENWYVGKKKCLSKEEIKKQLFDEVVKFEDLNKQAEEI